MMSKTSVLKMRSDPTLAHLGLTPLTWIPARWKRWNYSSHLPQPIKSHPLHFPFLWKSIGLPWWLSGKESACQCRRLKVQSLGGKDPPEEETATHSSILAWEIPRTEEPGGVAWGPKNVRGFTKRQT